MVKATGGWAETTMATLLGLCSDSAPESWCVHVGLGMTRGNWAVVGGVSLGGEEYPLTLKENPASTSSWRLWGMGLLILWGMASGWSRICLAEGCCSSSGGVLSGLLTASWCGAESGREGKCWLHRTAVKWPHTPFVEATAPLSLEMLRKGRRCRVTYADWLRACICCSAVLAKLCCLSISVDDLGLGLGQRGKSDTAGGRMFAGATWRAMCRHCPCGACAPHAYLV